MANLRSWMTVYTVHSNIKATSVIGYHCVKKWKKKCLKSLNDGRFCHQGSAFLLLSFLSHLYNLPDKISRAQLHAIVTGQQQSKVKQSKVLLVLWAVIFLRVFELWKIRKSFSMILFHASHPLHKHWLLKPDPEPWGECGACR